MPVAKAKNLNEGIIGNLIVATLFLNLNQASPTLFGNNLLRQSTRTSQKKNPSLSFCFQNLDALKFRRNTAL